jgi:uncharacterized cupredoxin-like copper-binding protein
LRVKTKLAVLFALLALVPFAVAACGDDDDETTTDAATTTEPADTGGDTGGGGSTVELTADPGGGLAYEQDSAEATAGTVTIQLTNDAAVPHDAQIEGPEGDLGGTEEISGGDTSEVEIELTAGDYTFYCSVPGHREAGMEGTLTVD